MTEQKATAAAEVKLDEAKAKAGEAASKRDRADEVESLADAEKQQRRTAQAALRASSNRPAS